MFQKERIDVFGEKFFVVMDGFEIARAYLYMLRNDLHERPFGFMEDVFVNDMYSEIGLESQLVCKVIKTANKYNCYKLVTARHSNEFIHKVYKKVGFADYGLEFRIDFD